jgi:hypothetical protein
MDLAGRPALGLKAPRGKAAPAYLAAIHGLPCCVCEAFGEVQTSPTEAHHVFHGRFGQSKTPDGMAIPLCDGHHQAKYDQTKLAIHNAKAEWAEAYGMDYDFTAATQDKIGATK